MWWRRNRQRELPATVESVSDLRAQLIAARREVRRQIEVQNSFRYSCHGGYSAKGDELAVLALQTELDEIEQSLAGLGPDDT